MQKSNLNPYCQYWISPESIQAHMIEWYKQTQPSEQFGYINNWLVFEKWEGQKVEKVKQGKCAWLETGGINLKCLSEGDADWMGNSFIVQILWLVFKNDSFKRLHTEGKIMS